MKLSLPFWGVIVGVTICLPGLAGITYFERHEVYWGNGDFWNWMPVSVIAACLGAFVMVASFIVGLISGKAAHPRDRDGQDTNQSKG